MVQFQTSISAACWCDPGADYEFRPALVEGVTRSPGSDQTAWFDELLEGGLQVPADSASPPLTMLLTGLPGTGKSTLALELAYRMARGWGWNSLYISTEGYETAIVNHAESLGWQRAIFDTPPEIDSERRDHGSVVVKSVRRKEDLDVWMEQIGDQRGVRGALYSVASALGYPAERYAAFEAETSGFQMIVFDNLNTFPAEKERWFSALSKLDNGTSLVLTILDSPPTGGQADFWEYTSDNVLRLERDYSSRYMIRTIEIVKARYQKHAYGKHQLKILSRFQPPVPQDRSLRLRDHPYREEGGIFVFPSMHFMLSRHNRMMPTQAPVRIPTPLEEINAMLDGHDPNATGFVAGQCVALRGRHGTHKSRLAHAIIVSRLIENKASRALIISLRDSEASTVAQLNSMMLTENDTKRDQFQRVLDTGRLEVAFFPPGFITPEEFFHRLQMSIARLRTMAPVATGATGPPEILLIVNSLDLLESHFPLCAQHPIFVPAVIEFLGFEGVTSFFIATDSEHDYGLQSMADPILEFKYVTMPMEDYARRLAGKLNMQMDQAVSLRGERQLVELEVKRFAGGTSAGKRCYLDLVKASDKDALRFIPREGLYAFPLLGS
jgi:KaiC/GvpD/RAD55 family RecA-like ATPase